MGVRPMKVDAIVIHFLFRRGLRCCSKSAKESPAPRCALIDPKHFVVPIHTCIRYSASFNIQELNTRQALATKLETLILLNKEDAA